MGMLLIAGLCFWVGLIFILSLIGCEPEVNLYDCGDGEE